jgi:adenosylcobyric acid synthase
MAFVGVIPWVEHGLPDEDGAAAPPPRPGSTRVAVVRYPTASNLDEFKALEQVAEVVWATSPGELVDADLVVLPGSKHVAGDLAWLRSRGLDRAIVERAARGDRVLGICGGLELLGGPIDDPAGVDGSATGLGLLPVRTTFRSEKRTERVETAFAALPEPWHALSRLDVRGYEIRHGDVSPTAPATEAASTGRGFVAGPVLGLTLHGALESPDVVAALVGLRPARTLESVFDGLADLVDEHLDIDALGRLAGVFG